MLGFVFFCFVLLWEFNEEWEWEWAWNWMHDIGSSRSNEIHSKWQNPGSPDFIEQSKATCFCSFFIQWRCPHLNYFGILFLYNCIFFFQKKNLVFKLILTKEFPIRSLTYLLLYSFQLIILSLLTLFNIYA